MSWEIANCKKSVVIAPTSCHAVFVELLCMLLVSLMGTLLLVMEKKDGWLGGNTYEMDRKELELVSMNKISVVLTA